MTHVAHEKIEVRMWYLNRHIAEEARMLLCSLNQWQLTGSSKERAGGETKLVWGEGGHWFFRHDNHQRLSQPLMILQLATGWYGKQGASAWGKIELGNQPANPPVSFANPLASGSFQWRQGTSHPAHQLQIRHGPYWPQARLLLTTGRRLHVQLTCPPFDPSDDWRVLIRCHWFLKIPQISNRHVLIFTPEMTGGCWCYWSHEKQCTAWDVADPAKQCTPRGAISVHMSCFFHSFFVQMEAALNSNLKQGVKDGSEIIWVEG